MGQGAEDLDTQWERETSRPVARIRKLSADRGIGMMEAKRIVDKADLVRDIRAAASINDVKSLLLRMVTA